MAILSRFPGGPVGQKSDSIVGRVWKETTLPYSSGWRSVVYGNGRFVAVADFSSDAAYSLDGILWVGTRLPFHGYWTCVTYGDGKFVAVANNSSKAAYSVDGIAWHEANMPSAGYWAGVTYGDGKFVAIRSDSNKIAHSVDGIVWEEVALQKDGGTQSIVYGNGQFIVCGEDGSLLNSIDGITWNLGTFPLYTPNGIGPMVFSAGRYVIPFFTGEKMEEAVGKVGCSVDGATWMEVVLPLPTGGVPMFATHGEGVFITVLYGTNKAAYSADGIVWEEATLPYVSTWATGTYGNGKIVVLTNYDNKAAYSGV